MGIKYVSNNALARAVSKIRGLIGAVEARLVPASTGQAGLVKLNNTLASASTAEALTAAQGKVLSDRLQTLSGQTYKFYEKYNFNVDEIAEDCIRITGGTTTGTKPPGGLYSLVFSYYPKSADGYTDGNYIVQTAIADNGKVYTRYNYSTPPSWSAWTAASADAAIADGSVTAGKLAAGSVTTAKLAAGAVTAEKLATGAVPSASTSQAGKVQLNNTLTSTSTTQALTAAQGKALNDKLVSGSTSQAGLVQLNNTLTSTSTTQALTAAQGKALNDKLPKYGVCSTTAATAAKTVSITGFVLATGSMVTVKFTYGNTASYPTLNVNGTGAKTVYRDASSYYPMDLAANDVVSFVYDGSYFRMLDIPDASTTRAGKVQLSNTLTSTSTTMALTAAQGKALNDKMLNITSGTFTLKTQNGANSRECSYYKLGPLVTIYGQLNNYDGTSAYLSGLPFKPVKSSSTLCQPMIADEYYMVTAATNGYLYMYDPSVHSYNTVSNQWQGQQFTITYVTAS